jgi:hypothetical protein
MSEIRQAAFSQAQEGAAVQDPPSTTPRALVPAQARRDFDAAIRRVSEQDGNETDDAETPEQTPVDTGLLPPGLLPYLSPGHSAQTVVSAPGELGGRPAIAMPTLSTSPLPDALPTATLASATGVGPSLRLQVPLGGAEAATLALRLAQTGAGQWQLRVGGDASTRQQLAPHLERLRDRLRERSAGGLEDLGFDDDIES